MSPLSIISSVLSDSRLTQSNEPTSFDAMLGATETKIEAECDAAMTQFAGATACAAAAVACAVGGAAAAGVAVAGAAAAASSLGAAEGLVGGATVAMALGAEAAMVASGAAAGAAAGAAGTAVSIATATTQEVLAMAGSGLGQLALDPQLRAGQSLSSLVDLLNGLGGGEPRNPLLLPEPWRNMVSTALQR